MKASMRAFRCSLEVKLARPGLKAVVVVESERDTGDKIERETRFYLTSLALMACMLGPIVRSHWAIENSLHWILDMVFRDDECRLRADHAPAILHFMTVMVWDVTEPISPNKNW